jgi:hypothetical protein
MMDTEEEQEHLFKIQLLQAFNLDEWDDDIINDSMVKLFDLMKLDSNLEKILLSLSKVEALQEVITMTNECIDMKYANAKTSKADASEADASEAGPSASKADTSEAGPSASKADTSEAGPSASKAGASEAGASKAGPSEAGASEADASEADASEAKKMVLFGLLFQYDYFDLFHKCVYDFTHHFCITEYNTNALLTAFIKG